MVLTGTSYYGFSGLLLIWRVPYLAGSPFSRGSRGTNPVATGAAPEKETQAPARKLKACRNVATFHWGLYPRPEVETVEQRDAGLSKIIHM